jgi:hypothetical protein
LYPALDSQATRSAGKASWRVAGSYLESCNCEAICPCRRIDGRAGGRSTFGVCVGALSWLIEEGHGRDVDLGGLGVVLACRYSDDEAGSPWDFVLYLDERADDRQAEELERIYTGAAGGTAIDHFPWAWKESRLLAVRRAAVEIEYSRRRGWFRAGDEVLVRVWGPVAGDATVTCVIPGHHRTGEEVVGDELRVADELLAFEFRDRCGYASTFDYAG